MSDTEQLLNSKQQWSSTERLELAAKLDADLEHYMAGLEGKGKGTDDMWSEERMAHELQTHPFFTKQSPQPGDELHPMYEGLQKLKYDPAENTAEELALNYKQDGNFYMKHKKFRIAIYSFTEGLKTGCVNAELLAVLYNNRSAAHYFLKNYRSSLADAERALKLKPDYAKPRWRAAQCAYQLERYDLCAQLCEQTLAEQPNNAEVESLLKRNRQRKLEHERNQRRALNESKQRKVKSKALRTLLNMRGIRFFEAPDASKLTDEHLQPRFLPLEGHAVHLDADDGVTLVWPVAFSYPEFLVSDYHQSVRDSDTMDDCLRTLFAEPLPGDKSRAYRPHKVSVYFENRHAGRPKRINTAHTIAEIITDPDFCVFGGCLLFYIVPTDSRAERAYLAEARRPVAFHTNWNSSVGGDADDDSD